MGLTDRLRNFGIRLTDEASRSFREYEYSKGIFDASAGLYLPPDQTGSWELVNMGPDGENTPMFRRKLEQK